MSWVPLALPIPKEISLISSGLSKGLNAVKTVLESIKAQAQILETLSHQVDDLTVVATNTVIQGLVTALNDTINSLLDDTGLYLLIVPLPKKGLIRLLASPNTPNEVGSNFLSFPANNILADLSKEEATQLRSTSLWDQISNPSEIFIGGNAYFVKTVAESLFDPLDNNRPKFLRSDSWAYTTMIAGANDLPSIMTSATFFERLFGQGQDANGIGATRHITSMVPKNVHITPSMRETGALIEWDPLIPRITLESFDNSVIVAKRFAIIRSTDFRAKSALRVTDFFDKDLSVGDTGLFNAEVIHVQDYDGVTSRWLDTSVKYDTPYYYHVAFQCQLNPNPNLDFEKLNADILLHQTLSEEEDKSNTSLTLKWDKMTAGIEFILPLHPDTTSPQRMGKAPDWVRTQSLARLLPPLNKFLDSVEEQLKTFATSSLTVTARNQQYLTFLDSEIQIYEKKITEIQHYINTLTNLLDGPRSGIYTTVQTGTGNVSSFLSSLSSQFANFSDTGRPPFDNGTEYVCGVVLLAVAPDPNQLGKALQAMLDLFTVSSSVDPILAGIQSVQTTLATVEQTLIDSILGGGDTTMRPQVFNPDMSMRPIGEGDASCDPINPPTLVVNSDGTSKVKG